MKKQHLYRAEIHLNEERQQILTSATSPQQSLHYWSVFSHKITDVNRVINNDQVSKIRVLSWNINGLGNKMTDLFTFIRNYDIIFFIETMKGNDFTLAILGYKFHHVSRKLKHKNACRASGCIGILISNKYANLTKIDHTYDYLVWLTLATDCCQKTLKLAALRYHQQGRIQKKIWQGSNH